MSRLYLHTDDGAVHGLFPFTTKSLGRVVMQMHSRYASTDAVKAGDELTSSGFH